ncbi:hypothetical protein B484DRAFT_321874 [Ochromonadaceae sp. CCMP2298]|nr:hypothetical protein B484DRAFT_321874 [Ochromonadaceae sp. CCMP2298]
MVLYGQVVVGPPGSGKTTYCHGMQLFCQEIGRRAVVVNLDFANDASALPYTPAVDVRDLVTLQEAMETHSLGPNGGLMFCMEELGRRVQWLEDRLRLLEESAYYVIFDCPGQVELYSHHSVFQRILQRLTPMGLGCRLCSVHLVDAFYCCQPPPLISPPPLATPPPLRPPPPHVNVLSKVDLASQYGPLPFQLSFFTECMNLAPLLSLLQRRFHRMSSALCEVVDDFGLVSFHPMNVQDAETVGRVLAATDSANGFSVAAYETAQWERRKTQGAGEAGAEAGAGTGVGMGAGREGGREGSGDTLFKIASRSLSDSTYSHSLDIQERYGI